MSGGPVRYERSARLGLAGVSRSRRLTLWCWTLLMVGLCAEFASGSIGCSLFGVGAANLPSCGLNRARGGKPNVINLGPPRRSKTHAAL